MSKVRQEYLTAEQIRDAKADFLCGIPIPVICNKYSLDRMTFYNNYVRKWKKEGDEVNAAAVEQVHKRINHFNGIGMEKMVEWIESVKSLDNMTFVTPDGSEISIPAIQVAEKLSAMIVNMQKIVQKDPNDVVKSQTAINVSIMTPKEVHELIVKDPLLARPKTDSNG